MSDTILPERRVCNTCGLEKLLTEYHRNVKSKGGYLPRCKDCRKIADAPYVEAHRDVIRSRARQWREKNLLAADKRAREWALKHPTRIKAIRDKFKKTEHGVLSSRAAVRNRRARLKGAAGKHSVQDIRELMVLQRCKCANCAKPLRTKYHVDHRVPLSRGGSNDRLNLELLCPACNESKGAKLPHVFAQENGRLI